MPQVREAVIVDYLRSAFSRSRPREPERDVFNSERMDDVAAALIKEILRRTNVKPEDVDQLIAGTAQPWGEQMMFGGKTIAFLAELPVSVASHHIDRQCGSSMATIHTAAMGIMLGYDDVVISCGIEHMTHVPMGGAGGASNEPSPIKPNMKLAMDPRYAKYEFMTAMNMGLTAEKLWRHAGITREEMDKWSFRSHQRATKALKEGFFKGEIMPVEVTMADGSKRVIDTDQSIRAETTLEGLTQLKPAYSPDGQITAGNASPLNAGATAMLLMSRDAAKKHGLKPLASVVSMGWAGVDPSMMGMGPVPASRKALKAAGMEVKDIDFWEINEAFAVVPLYAIKQLGIDPEKVNVKGGAVALGHPLGASGTRLVGTLARILNMEGGKYGLATPCVGGGQGVATIIKKE
jgi:acetyl-CoA C-acetyltransferase